MSDESSHVPWPASRCRRPLVWGELGAPERPSVPGVGQRHPHGVLVVPHAATLSRALLTVMQALRRVSARRRRRKVMTDTRVRSRGGRMQMPRSRGAMSGFLLILLGAWGALIPFVGPYFNFAFTPDQEWFWTS